MHEPVKSRLEDYLDGDGPLPDVEAHLAQCPDCRAEVAAMRGLSRSLQTLRSPREFEISANFYAGVMSRIETQTRPSAWDLFSDSLFARRLSYASAAFLLLLGTFLVSSTTDPTTTVAGSGPEVILAGDRVEVPPPIEVQPEQRGVVLVNLASYQQDYQ